MSVTVDLCGVVGSPWGKGVEWGDHIHTHLLPASFAHCLVYSLSLSLIVSFTHCLASSLFLLEIEWSMLWCLEAGCCLRVVDVQMEIGVTRAIAGPQKCALWLGTHPTRRRCSALVNACTSTLVHQTIANHTLVTHTIANAPTSTLADHTLVNTSTIAYVTHTIGNAPTSTPASSTLTCRFTCHCMARMASS